MHFVIRIAEICDKIESRILLSAGNWDSSWKVIRGIIEILELLILRKQQRISGYFK